MAGKAANRPGHGGETCAGAKEEGGPEKDASGPGTKILLFDTTHRAMEAESAIVGGGFWCEVVPRPPDAMSSLCGLAIEVLTSDVDDIRATLADAGIPFEIYQPEVEAH